MACKLTKEEKKIKQGIAAYRYEQNRLLKLVRKHGKLHLRELISLRVREMPIRVRPYSDKSFILGLDINSVIFHVINLMAVIGKLKISPKGFISLPPKKERIGKCQE